MVATPIGNLMDITKRASDVLENVDVIAAEDTRRTNILLKHLGIEKREVTSFHKFNESRKTPYLLGRIKRGDDVAIVSDAGTPLISDPGFSIVERAWAEKIPIVPIPGASSLTAALSVCPLKCDQWSFLGFLPSKSSERLKILSPRLVRPEALIFFEAPHRIISTLKLLEELSERNVMVAREITKVFETVYVGSSAEVQRSIGDNTKGEFLCIVEGSSNEIPDFEAEKVLRVLLEHHDMATASKITAKICGISKKIVYGLALEISGKGKGKDSDC